MAHRHSPGTQILIMKKIFPILFLSLLGAFAHANLKVVTTIPDLASFVSEIGKNKVSVSSLIVGARDPHRIEAKPSFMSRVSSADLFIAVGLELEIGYEEPILQGSRNSRVQIGARGHMYASDGVYILEKPTGNVTRAQGDVHPYGNPHVWLDPWNARIIVRNIATRMGELDRTNAAFYTANANAFVDRIDDAMFGSALVNKFGVEKLWTWERNNTLIQQLQNAGALGQLGGWEGKMNAVRGKSIITYHKSWVYFANRFNLRIVDELEPKPGIDPTPGHLAEVLREVAQSGAKVILQEPFYSTRDANFVAQRTGIKVVVVGISVGNDSSVSDYIGLISNIVNKVSAAAGG